MQYFIGYIKTNGKLLALTHWMEFEICPNTSFSPVVKTIFRFFLRNENGRCSVKRPKGQTISEWINEIIVSPKIQTKNCQEPLTIFFCILGERVTS